MVSVTVKGGASVLYGSVNKGVQSLYSIGAKVILSPFPDGKPNFNLAPIDDVYQSIASAIGKPFQRTDFNISAPISATDGVFNTKITVQAIDQSKLGGVATLWYPRVDAALLSTVYDLDLLRYDPDVATVHQALTKFNTLFGTKIPTEDFQDNPIATDGPTYAVALDTSYHFIPGTQVNLGALVPSDRDNEIPGLFWPAPNTAAQQAYFTKDMFRVAYNTLLGTAWTQAQTTLPDVSEINTGFGTTRERQYTLTFSDNTTDTIYYNRLNVGDLLSHGFNTTVYDIYQGKLLDPYNQTKLVGLSGIPIDNFEFVDTDVVDDTPYGNIDITLTANTGSKFFNGTITVTLTRATHLATVIPPKTYFAF